MKNFRKVITTIALTLIIGISTVVLFACGTTETNQFTINLSANNNSYGSVYGAGTYAQAEQITIYAVPKDGYEFVNWSDSSDERSPVRVIAVDKDISLTANFQAKTTQEVKTQYFLNSISLWISDYHGDAVSNAGLYSLKVSVNSNSLGGFNADPDRYAPNGSSPFIFNETDILHPSDKPLVIYLDKNEYNVFDENSTANIRIWYLLSCNPSDGNGHLREYNENYSIKVRANSIDVKVLYNDTDHNYTISMSFNFVEC